MSGLVCWNCGESLDDIPRPISRHATCNACFNELPCCRLCRHYDPKRNMQCFEDRADPPLQKENANFCDFFAPTAGAHDERTSTKSATAKTELDALFGRSPEQEPGADSDEAPEDKPDQPLTAEEEARKKLDDLFG